MGLIITSVPMIIPNSITKQVQPFYLYPMQIGHAQIIAAGIKEYMIVAKIP